MVLMQHVTIEHVRDGLEPAMRMRGEPGEVVVWLIRVKLVKHQKRIQAALGCDDAQKAYAPAVGRWAAGE
jgi:hypothetical protein